MVFVIFAMGMVNTMSQHKMPMKKGNWLDNTVKVYVNAILPKLQSPRPKNLTLMSLASLSCSSSSSCIPSSNSEYASRKGRPRWSFSNGRVDSDPVYLLGGAKNNLPSS